MPPLPVFTVHADPVPRKQLRRFRRDAGWAPDSPYAYSPCFASGIVRWATLSDDKSCIAIVRLELAPPQFCCISELIIASSHRHKGLGRYFIKQIEQYCAQHGIQRLLLQAVAEASGFYDALHFIPDPYVCGFLKREISPFQKKSVAGYC